MSHYPNLEPIFASSIMHVITIPGKVKFLNTITYDYKDLTSNPHLGQDGYRSYYDFLKISKNFNEELNLAWNNMQTFLNEEENFINQIEASQHVKHCNIYFRDAEHPFIQWLIEFEGPLKKGDNVYFNVIPPETLTYPIYSIYSFQPPLQVAEVVSSMKFNLNKSQGIIEYYGETGDELEGEEEITFHYV